jgi:hypothetical protein
VQPQPLGLPAVSSAPQLRTSLGDSDLRLSLEHADKQLYERSFSKCAARRAREASGAKIR